MVRWIFRWWNETRESLFREIDGVLYATSSCFSDDFESEIILDMRRSESDSDGCKGEEQGVSGREYALVSEWMFYRALKWLGFFLFNELLFRLPVCMNLLAF